MLILKSSITYNTKATSLFAFDKSGAYAADNLGGWGSPNPAVADATSAVVRIYLPDTITFLPSTTYTEIDVYDTLPSSTLTDSFEITAASLSVETIHDGWMIAKYIVEADGETYTSTTQKIITAAACCCVKEKLLEVDPNCGCDNKKMQMANKMWGMLRSVEFLAKCYQNRKAIATLKALHRLCNDCRPCGC